MCSRQTSHQSVTERLNAQFSHTESQLRIEVDHLRADCRHLQEQVKELSRENDLKARELSGCHARQEALQVRADFCRYLSRF